MKIVRRTYNVPRPHAMSHMDGYHKLIRWGFVIHGLIDGYSRLVSTRFSMQAIVSDSVWLSKITALRAHSDNRAGTVLKMFKRAERRYGLPSRVRGDRGGENIKVAVYIIIRRGRHRGSFIWGT